MKIVRLKCDCIRGLADGAYSFAEHAHVERPHDLVLVTGGPSSGKTSLLEAIAACKQAVGPYGRAPDPSRFLRRGAPAGSMEATFWLNDQELERTGIETRNCTVTVRVTATAFEGDHDRRLSRLLASYSHRPDMGKFEYFPANRQLFGEAWRPTPPRVPEDIEALIRLTRDVEKYAHVRRTLLDTAAEQSARMGVALESVGVVLRGTEPDLFASYKRAIAALSGTIRLRGVDVRGSEARVTFGRRDGTVLELDELGDAEQQAVLFAVTFRRIGLNHSVVLVDTPELHQHPAEHVAFLQGIASLGRDNQVIAATTSRDLLAGGLSARVIELPHPR